MAFAEIINTYPGVEERSIGFVDAVQEGLPVQIALDIAALIAPDNTAFQYQIVPKATLARRKRTDRLSPEEGERALRLIRLWAFALRILKTEDGVRDYLWYPNPLLGMRTAISLALASESGGRLVEDRLGEIWAGVAI